MIVALTFLAKVREIASLEDAVEVASKTSLIRLWDHSVRVVNGVVVEEAIESMALGKLLIADGARAEYYMKPGRFAVHVTQVEEGYDI